MKLKFIKFKKLSDTAIVPTKAHAYDAGFDLFADEDVTLMYGETKVIQTNIAIELPDGYMADVRPRSGLTLNTSLRVHYGTVDATYRGSVGIICENAAYNMIPDYMESLKKIERSKDEEQALQNTLEAIRLAKAMMYEIKRGDKIAQLVIQKIPDVELFETDVLNETNRGSGGFGSTGT